MFTGTPSTSPGVHVSIVISMIMFHQKLTLNKFLYFFNYYFLVAVIQTVSSEAAEIFIQDKHFWNM